MQIYLDFILKKISPVKSQLKNKSILVTGASGFIGKWIILLLLEWLKSPINNIYRT